MNSRSEDGIHGLIFWEKGCGSPRTQPEDLTFSYNSDLNKLEGGTGSGEQVGLYLSLLFVGKGEGDTQKGPRETRRPQNPAALHFRSDSL